MSEDQVNQDKDPDAQIIRRPVDLQNRVVLPGNGDDAARDAIAKAEQALEDLSVNFDDWMKTETNRLLETRDAAIAAGFSANELEIFYQAAHNLKGQACTLGYPFADEICASLCRLLDKTGDKSRLPVALVKQHVDAVRAMVNEQAKGSENPKASILVKRLRDVTNEFVSQELQRNAAA